VFWKTAKDRLIETLERENARLLAQNEQYVLMLAKLAENKAPEAEKARPRATNMPQYLKSMSAASWDRARVKGKNPLAQGIPSGAEVPVANS